MKHLFFYIGTPTTHTDKEFNTRPFTLTEGRERLREFRRNGDQGYYYVTGLSRVRFRLIRMCGKRI